jgi:hypothetical protein
VVDANEAFLLFTFCGRAKGGRWRGRARGVAAGGEIAECGGDAMMRIYYRWIMV